ncbi:MAG TPA: SUF system NifU family Fe-S cluster assembly protein [Vicinamibacteria bacterium]|nr:SUF system NifU family Fe-S cluster assembly protein [Vicinamibacteria bacterium]
MDDLRELYQETILDHSKRPRNFHPLAGANRSANGHNPLCGDRTTVYLHVADDVVRDVSFQGAGCSISTASASMMTDALKGKTVAEAKALFERFHELVTADPAKAVSAPAELGKLAVFAGVHEFPIRVKCASLPWHTMKAALEGGDRATTE